MSDNFKNNCWDFQFLISRCCNLRIRRLSCLRCSRAPVFRRICLMLDNSKLGRKVARLLLIEPACNTAKLQRFHAVTNKRFPSFQRWHLFVSKYEDNLYLSIIKAPATCPTVMCQPLVHMPACNPQAFFQTQIASIKIHTCIKITS